jgi:lipopolysaccharide biosynthesis protein
MTEQNIKAIAFYLPQYHPIPENDEWWGNGFTEWTNVTKAKPLFEEHYQPHLPADLGFYDLRLPEARQAQADLAREYGIYGFCYYHYWFNGKRLLERPFQEVLESGKPDFPFCLCWANENWTRVWDGGSKSILMKQEYTEEGDREHIRFLIPAFQDDRYIKIKGKPLFLVYRAKQIPDALTTTSIWREEVKKAGFEDIFLCRVESYSGELSHIPPNQMGFDAAVEFHPDHRYLEKRLKQSKIWGLARKLNLSSRAYKENRICDYASVVATILSNSTLPHYPFFPCVTPMWDNSARRKVYATILSGSTPELYEHWLQAMIERALSNQSGNDEKFVFINAWNEWAEGNHLEPCQKWGRQYLEATQRALLNCLIAK